MKTSLEVCQMTIKKLTTQLTAKDEKIAKLREALNKALILLNGTLTTTEQDVEKVQDILEQALAEEEASILPKKLDDERKCFER